jgi:hypothetical protein
MLFFLLTWQFGKLMMEKLQRGNIDHREKLEIVFKVYIAERYTQNYFLFKHKLKNEIHKHLDNIQATKEITKDSVKVFADLYPIPIRRDPFLQVSDALSFIIRAFLNDAHLAETVKDIVKSLESREIEAKDINNPKIKTFCRQLKSAYFPEHSRRIQGLYQLRNKSNQSRSITQTSSVLMYGPVEPLLEQILQNTEKCRQFNSSTWKEKLEKLAATFTTMKPEQQAQVTDHIIESVHHCIQGERDYRKGDFGVDLLYRFIDIQRKNNSLPEESLNRRELKTAVLYLFLKNHRGKLVNDDERVSHAASIVPNMQSDITCWTSICDFHNNLAVSNHNEFQFEKTI